MKTMTLKPTTWSMKTVKAKGVQDMFIRKVEGEAVAMSTGVQKWTRCGVEEPQGKERTRTTY